MRPHLVTVQKNAIATMYALKLGKEFLSNVKSVTGCKGNGGNSLLQRIVWGLDAQILDFI